MTDAVRSLPVIPLFAGFSATDLQQLQRCIQKRTFEHNQIINQENRPWEGLYIVRSGSVKLSKKASGSALDRELILAILGPGMPLNIAPLFEGGVNAFTTRALGRVEASYLTEIDARRFVSDHPSMQKLLLRTLNMRIRQLVSLAMALSFTGVTARLAAWMLEQSSGRGTRTDRGVQIERDLSVRDLGYLMGTVGRVLSRSLAELRRERVIDVTPDHIVILDQKRLRAKAYGNSSFCRLAGFAGACPGPQAGAFKPAPSFEDRIRAS